MRDLALCRAGAERNESVCTSFYARFLDAFPNFRKVIKDEIMISVREKNGKIVKLQTIFINISFFIQYSSLP
jgi:hypothetical protein